MAFENNISAANSWLWDFGDGTSGAVQKPMHTYDSLGIYNVSVIVAHENCVDTVYKTLVVEQGVGIGDLEFMNSDFKVYPNPTGDGFTVEVRARGKREIAVYDLKGRLVTRIILKDGASRLTVSTEGWSKGVYLCSLEVNGKAVQSEKVVIR